MDTLRIVLAYLVPVFGALGAGTYSPFPIGTWQHSLLQGLAGAVLAYFTLRVHPNGVNGPPRGAQDSTKSQAGRVPLLTLFIFLACAVVLLPLVGCTTIGGAICQPGTLSIDVPFKDGSCNLYKRAPDPATSATISLACSEGTQSQSAAVTLPCPLAAPATTP